MNVIELTTRLVPVTCYSCGTVFAMTDNLNRQCMEKGTTFCCPNGHRQAYGNSLEKQYEKKLAQERARADQFQADAREQKLQREKAEAKLARTRKRVGNGVCPCCRRTFKQLAAHMKTQHPEYAGGREA